MQNTLMRLMKKKGLRRDPFQRLVTTAITPIDENFTDNPNPNPNSSENPLSSKKLRIKNKGDFAGAEPPSSKQDPFLKPLKSNEETEIEIEGQDPPTKKQNPLLRNLQGNNQGRFQGQRVPSFRQDNLLRQLRPGHTGADVEGIEPPSRNSVIMVSMTIDTF